MRARARARANLGTLLQLLHVSPTADDLSFVRARVLRPLDATAEYLQQTHQIDQVLAKSWAGRQRYVAATVGHIFVMFLRYFFTRAINF